MRLPACPLVTVVLLLPATLAPAAEPASDAFTINARLGRGINLGNALESPRPGAWGMEFKPEYLRAMKQAGFDSVRVPIRWSAHAATEAPYTIRPDFFALVDTIVQTAQDNDLAIVINFHHYEELYANPDVEQPRFLALWRQVADRYRDRPETVVFELLNEPHAKLTHELWQAMFPAALAVVRESNPTRAVIIGPGNWNNVSKLPDLVLPENDRMLIGTFHYYNPFRFTHQQASWVPEGRNWKDIPFNATPEEVQAIADDFAKAASWSKQQNRPVYVGEFGAYQAADMPSRARWTATITRTAIDNGFSTAYWEFAAGFGAYDRRSSQWRKPLLEALIPKP